VRAHVKPFVRGDPWDLNVRAQRLRDDDMCSSAHLNSEMP